MSVDKDFRLEFIKYAENLGWIPQDIAAVALDQYAQWLEKNPPILASEISVTMKTVRESMQFQIPKTLLKRWSEILRAYPHEEEWTVSDLAYYVIQQHIRGLSVIQSHKRK